MVLKPTSRLRLALIAFESSVNSDGTQTAVERSLALCEFESSVNSDGTQT